MGRYGQTGERRKAELERQKREEEARNKAAQEGYMSDLEKKGEGYFTGEKQRADERDASNQSFGRDAYGNLNQNTETVGMYEGNFRSEQSKLKNEAEAQSRDATNVYQSLTPRYEDMMNKAQTESRSAMSLADAMDPNNKVAAGTRQLYDQYGNQLRDTYNTEADQAQNQYTNLGRQAESDYNRLGANAQQGYNQLGQLSDEQYQDLAGQTQGYYDQYGQQSQDRYNTEAQAARKRFEDAAQGENRLGLSNYGALSALGAQAAQNTQGPGPMTVGQQMAGLAAANRQAGEAFANTQRRMQGLKDQGMLSESELRRAGLTSRDTYAGEGLGKATSQRQTGLASRLGLREKGLDSRNQYDEKGVGSKLGLSEKGIDTRQSLRNAGIQGQDAYLAAGLDRGFERSDSAYAKGLDAKDRYRQSVYDREALTDRNVSRQSSLRSERGGYDQNIRGSSANQEQTRFGNKMTGDSLRNQIEQSRIGGNANVEAGRFDFARGMTGMRMGREDINTDRSLGAIDRVDRLYDARNASQDRLLGTGIQVAGTVAGGIAGGPAGAMAGSQLGGAISGGIQGQPYQGNMGNNSSYGGNNSYLSQNQWFPQKQQPTSLTAQNYGMPMQQPPMQGAGGYGRYNLGVNPYGQS